MPKTTWPIFPPNWPLCCLLLFPGGELDCVRNIQMGKEHAGFEIHDVERLRPHYALTLRHWVHRLEANREAAALR